MALLIDMTGKVVHRMTVLRRAENDPIGHARWWVQCHCGREFEILANSLRRGLTKSCGCISSELKRIGHITHGQTTHGRISSEYGCWQWMTDRCGNPRNKNYRHYGGRGIKVCDRWIESFENFLSDMGKKPSAAHSLDRKDNDGNYEPGNCRWATRAEQSNNKRSNRRLTLRGETRTLAEWSERFSVSRRVVGDRLRRGWDLADALTRPIDRSRVRRPDDAGCSLKGESA